MKKLLFILAILPILSASQDIKKLKEVYGKKYNKANTAKYAFYMGKQERMTYLWLNLARIDGKLFTEYVVIPYTTSQNQNGHEVTNGYNRVVKSLINNLSMVDSTKNIPMLKPSFRLHIAAQIHAILMGLRGKSGHDGFKTRMVLTLNLTNETGECCAYGFKSGLDNVMQLLIDYGVSGFGHRYACLSPNFYRAGVSIKYHKKYNRNCVIDFSSPTPLDYIFRNKEVKKYNKD